jgi:hypothetical protein
MFNRLLEEAGMDWDVIALFFSEHPKPWTTLKMHENHQQKIRFFFGLPKIDHVMANI